MKIQIQGCLEAIDYRIRHARFDKTFKAQISKKLSYGKYEIVHKGSYHTASCNDELQVGSTVRVCAPENNWNELYIVLADTSNKIVKFGDVVQGALQMTRGTTVTYNMKQASHDHLSGYERILRFTITRPYAGFPFAFTMTKKFMGSICNVVVAFADTDNTDPGLQAFTVDNGAYELYMVKAATGVWDLYSQKSAYQDIIIFDLHAPMYDVYAPIIEYQIVGYEFHGALPGSPIKATVK